MRVLAHIPHPLMRISITSWNEKFQLRFELDRFEQVFKIGQDEVSSLEAVKQMGVDMAESVLIRFVSMRESYNQTNTP
jgi:hypothetical protein